MECSFLLSLELYRMEWSSMNDLKECILNSEPKGLVDYVLRVTHDPVLEILTLYISVNDNVFNRLKLINGDVIFHLYGMNGMFANNPSLTIPIKL